MNPDSEVRSQRRTRRTFTLAQREAILTEYDACESAADRAALIRTHALYQVAEKTMPLVSIWRAFFAIIGAGFLDILR